MQSWLRVPSLSAAVLLLLGACARTPPPVEVTRFHLGSVTERGTIALQPTSQGAGPEFDLFAKSIGRELRLLGFAVVGDVEKSLYVAVLDVETSSSSQHPRSPALSIGLGGSTGGWHSGIGAGVSVGVAGGRALVVGSQISLALKRRSDETVVWEGRARGEASARDSAALPDRLAAALFRDFPGESGRTISVP